MAFYLKMKKKVCMAELIAEQAAQSSKEMVELMEKVANTLTLASSKLMNVYFFFEIFL
jgi:vacuolar-type H+-ATPase subunit D/Vma8